MKILVCDKIAPEGVKRLEAAGHEVDVRTGLAPDELEKVIEPYHAVIVRSATKIRKPHIDRAKNLKVIARGGVGVDNIDVEHAEARGIRVLNTPGASTVSVAELTFAHLLAAARNVGRGTVTTKAGQWEKKACEGVELSGKTLGLIGCGRIAREVARRAAAFGMKVLGSDPYVKAGQAGDVEVTSLDRVIAESDFISLHTPLTDETRNIVNEAAIAKMKKGVVIVNCGRGGTLDETALARALDSGHVRAAGLDVFSTEPVPGDYAILTRDNVSFTPHVGASTAEAQARVGVEVAQVVIDALK